MRGLMGLTIALALAACALGGAAVEFEKEPVELKTSDGVSVSGYFVKGGGGKAPAVVLLHMLGGAKEDWDGILRDCLLPGTTFSYLAIDLRGHGESTRKDGESISAASFGEGDFRDMTRDVKAAVDYLRRRDDVDGDSIAVVGASIGANVAINYAAEDERIKAAAMLSGALDYRGVTTADAIARYGVRPLFLAAAKEDLPAGRQIKRMAAKAGGRKVVSILQGNLHGTRMFGATPVGDQLADFLNTYLE